MAIPLNVQRVVTLAPNLTETIYALGLDGKDSAVLYNVGCLYAILGRRAAALRCLRKVVRSGWRKEWIRHDPDWTALRGMKEFVALVS